MIDKLQGLAPEDLEKVLRLVDSLTSSPQQRPTPTDPTREDRQAAENNGPVLAPDDSDDEARPWRGIFEAELPRRDPQPLHLANESLPPRDQPFDILWDPQRHDD
jgi:hypothetical protein